MSCDARIESLIALTEGGLAPAEREATLRHLEDCDDCRGLFAALVDAGRASEDAALVDSVLAHTSGTACDRASELLPERLDGTLDRVDAELVEGHLRHCRACSELASALELLQQELPRLAHADPGPGFVEGVLARTSRKPRPVAWTDPIATFLDGLVRRRRIAWEGAFVATFCLVVPMALPGSPLAVIPRRALGIVREAPQQSAEAIGRLRESIAISESPLARGASAALGSAGLTVTRTSRSVWLAVAQSSNGALNALSQSLGTFVGPAASGESNHDNVPRPVAPGNDQEKNR